MDNYRLISQIKTENSLYKNHLDNPEIFACAQLLDELERLDEVYKNHLRNILKNIAENYLISKLTSSSLHQLLKSFLDERCDSQEHLEKAIHDRLKNFGFMTDHDLIETFMTDYYDVTDNQEDTELIINIYLNFKKWWRGYYDLGGKFFTRNHFLNLMKSNIIYQPYVDLKSGCIRNIKSKPDDWIKI